jgi:hypothetical protein
MFSLGGGGPCLAFLSPGLKPYFRFGGIQGPEGSCSLRFRAYPNVPKTAIRAPIFVLIRAFPNTVVYEARSMARL